MSRIYIQKGIGKKSGKAYQVAVVEIGKFKAFVPTSSAVESDYVLEKLLAEKAEVVDLTKDA